jgi:hypothetical protein
MTFPSSVPPSGEPPVPAEAAQPPHDAFTASEADFGYEVAFPFLTDAGGGEG